MYTKKSSESGKENTLYRPVIAVATVRLPVCGVSFPPFTTGTVQDSGNERGRN